MSVSYKLKNVTLCYPHLFEKHAPPGTDKLRYSAEFILDPMNPSHASQIAELDEVFRRVATEAGKGTSLQYIESPVQFGDQLNNKAMSKGKKPRAELAGNRIIRANDYKYQPVIVGAQMQPIGEAQRDQIFGGCVVNASIDLYWSRNATNPGVYVGLRGVQLVDNVNVTPIGGGGRSAEDLFEPVAGAPEPLQQAGDTSGGSTDPWG